MRDKVTLPTCLDCPSYLFYSERWAAKQNGVLMKTGERYCLAKKKAVRFSKRDPKRNIPAWCPKRKSPCELRVYGFKSTRDWLLHEMLCRDLEQDLAPEASRYCVEQVGFTELTPKALWDGLENELLSELFPVTVLPHWVIEIDDGIKPICFYKTDGGLKIVPRFDTAKARANRKEDEE